MAIISKSSGYIGLGSRLFLGKESSWSTAVSANSFEQFNVYNQEGSRPQKVTTPIEVSQLYPSMLRRKPIKNSVSVEGAYTFSLPTSNVAPFMELITGDAGTGGGTSTITDASIDPAGTQANSDRSIKAKLLNFTEALVGHATFKKGETITLTDVTDANAPKLATATFIIDSVDSTGGAGNDDIVLEDTSEQFARKLFDPETVTVSANANVSFLGNGSYLSIIIDIGATSTAMVIDEVIIGSVTDFNNTHGFTVADIQGTWSKALGNVTSISYSDGDGVVTILTTLETSASSAIATMSATANVELFDLTNSIAVSQVNALGSSATNFELQEVIDTSYSFLQTIGVHQLALYTGMMSQSATFNVSPDDVANVEISFLGADEAVEDASQVNINNTLGDDILVSTSGKITGLAGSAKATYDNCVEFYPSWSTTLYINRKDGANFQTPSNVGWANNASPLVFFAGPTTTVPFSDLSLTVNNNLEFPAYLNGTKTRNQPVQTTYKEVTGSITLPYNEYTKDIIASIFDQDNFYFRIEFALTSADAEADVSIQIDLPEVCITGDSLADIPGGEMTLPINFGAYAPKGTGSESDNYASASPLTISLLGAQS